MTHRQHLNRREFLRAAIAGAGAALMPALARGSQQSKPNIIFIIADDMGWADIGYHNTEVLTPNLDKLARQSVRLERHYVMPTCTPTRIGLMTGRYQQRFGHECNGPGTPQPGYTPEQMGMETSEKTLGDVMKACLLYTSPSPRDLSTSRMPSSA